MLKEARVIGDNASREFRPLSRFPRSVPAGGQFQAVGYWRWASRRVAGTGRKRTRPPRRVFVLLLDSMAANAMRAPSTPHYGGGRVMTPLQITDSRPLLVAAGKTADRRADEPTTSSRPRASPTLRIPGLRWPRQRATDRGARDDVRVGRDERAGLRFCSKLRRGPCLA